MPNKFLTYNGVEFEETLGLNMYEMDMCHYDAAIARWVVQDPVVHFNYSPYQAFDNNPVYWADPSGADSQTIYDLNGDPWEVDCKDGKCGDAKRVDPKEGQARPVTRAVPRGAVYQYGNEYYHSGGVNGVAGWYSEEDYLELFRYKIRMIGQGQASIESLNSYNFTDDMFLVMVGWALQAYDYYGGEVPLASGRIEPLYFTSPFFAPGIATKLLRGKTFSFWDGYGAEKAAEMAGYRVIGGTRAGQNLTKLTAKMTKKEARLFWDKLSAALANSYKPGSTAHVYLSRSFMKNKKAFANSTWKRIEERILKANGVKIKYHYTK